MDTSWLQPTLFFVFFSFTLSFSFSSLLLFLFRLLNPCCGCDVCRTYLSSAWRAEFDNLGDWYAHLLRRAPTATIHLHVLRNAITAHPPNLDHILRTNFHNYPKGKPFSAILGDLLGRGIFNVDGDRWLFQKKIATLELGSLTVRSHAFNITLSHLRACLLPFLSATARRGDRVLDLQDAFRRFSFDAVCRISLGMDPDRLRHSLPVSDLVEAFDVATRLSAERAMAASPAIWKLKRFLNLGSERRLRKSIKVVDSLVKEMIRQKRKLGRAAHTDLLSRFMASVSDDEDYLRDTVVSFLLAGRDTVASALTSFFWLVAQRPDVVAGIRAESDRIVGATADGPGRFEQMKDMHYLRASVHETLRLYPPVQFSSKYTRDDDVFPDGTFVAKGTRVTYHPYAMGRMERVWGSDWAEFRPERWLREGVFVPENPFKYPVFQAGLRVCLGREIALAGISIVALSLIRRFDIQILEPDRALRFSPGLTATLVGGLPAAVRERKVQDDDDEVIPAPKISTISLSYPT